MKFDVELYWNTQRQLCAKINQQFYDIDKLSGGNKCTYILSKPLNDASINAIDFANELILVTNNCSAEFGCGHHFLQVYISPLEVRSTKQSLALEIGVNSFGNDVDQGFSIKRLLNNVSNAF